MPGTSHEHSRHELLEMTTEIVASYAGNNSVPIDMIPDVIRSVHDALATASIDDQQKVETPKPSVSIRKSVQPDFIVCLEDGKKLTMLKRHLKTRFGMTPDEYRARWNLPADYPMVAPNYAAKRSELAKSIGLGKKQRKRSRSGS